MENQPRPGAFAGDPRSPHLPNPVKTPLKWIDVLRHEPEYVHAVRKAICWLKERRSQAESRRLGRCAPIRPLDTEQQRAVLDYAIALSEAKTEEDVRVAVRELEKRGPRA